MRELASSPTRQRLLQQGSTLLPARHQKNLAAFVPGFAQTNESNLVGNVRIGLQRSRLGCPVASLRMKYLPLLGNPLL
jgi:hypothetical protein